MKVSVLIDTYNHEHFIERAIISVLEQDMAMDEVEILVVDDGSTDRTPEVAHRFERRVRLAQLSGDIVAMLDGDDWWEKEKLRLVLDAFQRHPAIGAVGNSLNEVDAD